MLTYILFCILTLGLLLYIVKKTVSKYFPRYAYRFGSFAPIRKNCQVKWFVDGQDYMSAVGDAIIGASKEILITSWQLNPCIFIKRPDNGVTGEEWRLDKVLLRKADEGVIIHILLFNETVLNRFVLGVDFTKKVLAHPNIRLTCNPTLLTSFRYPSSVIMCHHEKLVVVDRAVAFVGGIDFAFERWDTSNHPLTDNYPLHPNLTTSVTSKENKHIVTNKKYQRWIGKDYGNTFVSGYITSTGYEQPMEDTLERSWSPRLPYHDLACCFTGPAIDDVVKHFNQRLQAANSIFWKGDFLPSGDEFNFEYFIQEPNSMNVNLQVLRSGSMWSTKQPCEDSIQQAILNIIKNAKHFIYFETQFFISSQPRYLYNVKNQVSAALAKRITKAYINKEDFHVMFMMPLKPDFNGDWETGLALRSVSYWNYSSLYTGKHSLYNRLKANGIPKELIGQYFSVYGLRKNDSLNGKHLTEIIYIHSKLIIVDDRISILGSANINDRSLLGNRDSDVSVIIEDTEMIPGTMNGQPFQVGKFSHSLRCHLYREHLDLLDDTKYETSLLKVDDPMSIRTQLNEMATRNTAIYEHVFGGKIDVTNHARNIQTFKSWKDNDGLHDDVEIKKELDKVQGRIVINQLLFLEDDLGPSIRDIFGAYT